MLHGKCTQSRRAPWIGAFFVWVILFGGQARAGNGSDCAADHIDEWAQVADIYDGDTLRLRDGRVIRFIAINAPELAHDGHPAQPLAQEARQVVTRMLPVGSRVGMRFDAGHFDPHHRVLAHIFDSQGRNVSAALLRAGYAFAIAIPPNLWNSRCYFQQEALARTDHRGIWGEDSYRPRLASQFRTHTGGFYRIRGRIDHIGRSRRSVWLDMGSDVAVRIPRKNLPYFAGLPINNWLDKEITVRGWASYYDHKLNLTLTHPAMIETTP